MAELDELKGMAMKVGQILSYMDGAVPERAQRRLAALQRGQSPLPFAQMRPVLEQGLGAPLEQLYDSIDEVAVAAASIGQVHRGRLEGREVAVKLQYPGVRETFSADVTQLRRIAGLAGLATQVDGQAIVDDLRDRLMEECDYLHEMRWQRRFAEWFADDPDIEVPAVFEDRCAETVLTTAWCEGVGLDVFTEAPQAARDRAGLALARFAWMPMFAHGSIHADPHPGNQLYRSDGRVVVLDFGFVRTFERSWLDATRQELLAVLDSDRPSFVQAVRAGGMVARADRFDFDAHWEMQRHLWAPYIDKHHRFEADWLREGQRFSRPSNKNLRSLAIPPPWIWLTRLQWGLHTVLVRLGASGRYRDVLREALESAPS